MHDGWVVSVDAGAHTAALSADAGAQWGSAYLGADKIVNATSRFSAASGVMRPAGTSRRVSSI